MNKEKLRLMLYKKRESSIIKSKLSIFARLINFCKTTYYSFLFKKNKFDAYENEKEKVIMQILAGISIPEKILKRLGLKQIKTSKKPENVFITSSKKPENVFMTSSENFLSFFKEKNTKDSEIKKFRKFYVDEFFNNINKISKEERVFRLVDSNNEFKFYNFSFNGGSSFSVDIDLKFNKLNSFYYIENFKTTINSCHFDIKLFNKESILKLLSIVGFA